jgi:hypothetical protein
MAADCRFKTLASEVQVLSSCVTRHEDHRCSVDSYLLMPRKHYKAASNNWSMSSKFRATTVAAAYVSFH